MGSDDEGKRNPVVAAAVWVAEQTLAGAWGAAVGAVISGTSVAVAFAGITGWPWRTIGGIGAAVFALVLGALLVFGAKIQRRASHGSLVVDLEGPHIRHSHYGLLSTVRIHVRNQSQKTVRKVRVEFERCTQQYVYKVLLERMNKEPNPFSLDPDADTYMDLVYLEKGAKDYVLAYKMDLLPPGTGCRIQVQPLELVVSVCAKNTAKTLHSFGVWVEPNGELQITKY